MKHNRYPGGGDVSNGTEKDALTFAEKQQAVSAIGEALYDSKHDRARFAVSDVDGLGAIDSGHDVFFARLDGGGDTGVAQAVAIKRYRTPEAAQRELDNLASARQRGFTTLSPVKEGTFPIGDLGAALVTEKVPNFTTMNYVGWRDFQVGQPGYEQVARTLNKIGGFVGRLHGAGITHGDLQIKNVGQVPPEEFIVFDLEKSSFFDPQTTSGDEAITWAGKCYDDLRLLVRSLIDKRFLETATEKLFESEIADSLLAPYLESGGHLYVLDKYDELRAEASTYRQHVAGQTAATLGYLGLK